MLRNLNLYSKIVYNINKKYLQQAYDAINYLYEYININTFNLYEFTTFENDINDFLYALIYLIKHYRHQNILLNIFKHIMNLLKIRIRYEKMNIYNTNCGKIIIEANYLYNYSLYYYIEIMYKHLRTNKIDI